jgi:DNA-3-methyladenine glycosylase II
MFAIFSLRRPDILPIGKLHVPYFILHPDAITIGDLGVQRGLLRWFLSLHSPSHGFSLSPEKIDSDKDVLASQDKDALPSFGEESSQQREDRAASLDISSVPPAADDENGLQLPTMPAPFTPSINRTLNKVRKNNAEAPLPLPEGLTVGILKSRLDGKKVK